MLKYLAVLLITFPVVANSQVENNLKDFFQYDLKVVCGPTSDVLKEISKYKEKLTWSSTEDSGTLISLWTNETTRSFTLIKTTKDAVASCIIGYSSGNKTL